MDVKEKIYQHFNQNKGCFFVNALHSKAEKYQLEKMARSGEITRIKKGVYIDMEHPLFDERILISNMYPRAVFCLLSSLSIYGLTTSLPNSHNIALQRNTKVSVPDYPNIQVYYWGDMSYSLGIIDMEIADHNIKIYNPEKSVCDAIRHRGKIGEDITLEVIKNYMHLPNKDLIKLMQYAKVLRIATITEQYIKPLL